MTNPAAPPVPTVPSRLRRVAAFASTALVAGAAAGLVVGLTIRDAWYPLAAFHYATPVPLVIAAAAAAALVAARLGRRRTAIAGAVVLAAAAAVLSATSVRTEPMRSAHASQTPAAGAPAALRGLLWNVEHGRHGWSHLLRWAASRDPDLVVLIEGPGRKGPGLRAIRETFPQHAVEAFSGHMVIIAKGRIGGPRMDRLATAGGRGASADVTFDAAPDRPVRVVAIDIPSPPFLSRRRMMEGALALGTAGSARTIVAGDFNTPRTSAFFDPWRGPLRHAWETAGTGYDATWPNPIPVLAIDHVWTDAGIEVLSCAHGGSRASDHRPVEFTFRIAE